MTGADRSEWNLAQLNLAVPRAGLGSAAWAEFLAAVDVVNRVADDSPGFVWRLRSGEAHGTTIRWGACEHAIANLSLWQSYGALHAFVYRSVHGPMTRRRAQWFEPTRQPSTVLWWVDPEERPALEDGLRRLRFLRAHGPSPRAFSLRRQFGPDGRAVLPRSRRSAS